MENNYNYSKDKKIKNLLDTCTRLLSNGLYYKAYTDALSILDIDHKNEKAKKIACLSLIQMYDLQTAISFFDNKDANLNSIFEAKKNEFVNNLKKDTNYNLIIKLLNTLSIHNAYFPKVTIFSHSKSNRGVIAKRFITQNEIIMTIPKEFILTVDTAKESDIGKQISLFMNMKLNSPKHSLLSSFILYEKNKENSKWSFYYDIFPKDFHTYPFFCNESENFLLSGSKFLLKVKEKRKDIEEDYKVLCSMIDNYNVSFNDFFRMRIIVSSRIFGIKINGIKVDALVPLADMLNHSTHNQTSWYYDEQIESFVVQAIEDIKEGNEIFDSYGKKPNSSYLLNYGFTIEHNEEYNEYPLTLILNRDSCELFSIKEDFIKSELGYERTFNITHHLYDSNVIDLFSYLRFVCFDNEDNIQLLFDEIRKGQDYTYINQKAIPLFYHIEPFVIENELKVLHRLKEICQCELTNYQSSYEDDIEILNGQTQLIYNQRNCIIIRISEKEILLFYIAFCEYCIELLSLNSKDKIVSKVSYDYKDNNCPYEYYISNILRLFKDNN